MIVAIVNSTTNCNGSPAVSLSDFPNGVSQINEVNKAACARDLRDPISVKRATMPSEIRIKSRNERRFRLSRLMRPPKKWVASSPSRPRLVKPAP